MKIKSMSKSLDSITFEKRRIHGKEYGAYIADCGCIGGKRIRIARSTHSALTRAVKEWYGQRGMAGDAGTAFTPTQMADATMALSILKEKGITTRLSEIVMDYTGRMTSSVNKVPLMKAYEDYVARFNAEQQTSIRIAKMTVGKFAAKFPTKMTCDITVDDVRSYLSKFNSMSERTWNNQMTAIKTFFVWCAKKVNHYVDENPIADMEKKTLKHQIPEFVKPDAVRALFKAALESESRFRDIILYRLTLNFFCGIRQDEIKRLPLDDVRLEDHTILIRAVKGSQSGRCQRAFTIPVVAEKWLRETDFDEIRETVMGDTTFNKEIRILKAKTGLSFPESNGGRHTFCTMHIAEFNQPSLTAGIAGNSPAMLRAHYNGLATKTEADAFWAITPESVRAEARSDGGSPVSSQP